MTRKTFIFCAFVAAAALFALVGCGSSSSNGGDGDADQEMEAEAESENALPFEPASAKAAPDPFKPGPFPVGVTTIDYYDENQKDKTTGKPRWLRCEIWYPVGQKYKDGPFFTYDLKEQAKDAPLGEKKAVLDTLDIPQIPTKTIRDAEIDREHGPYPIIFFSHGANGIRWQSIFYTIHLASHGYIVVAMDHEGNTLWDIIRDGYRGDTVAASAPKRLKDLPFLLDRMLAANEDAESRFYKMIIPDKVGITGHSFGGFTSVTVPTLDDRFKVSVPHAPVISLCEIWGCDMANYPVPIMVMGGTKDNTLKWRDQYCDYRALGNCEKYVYELERGGHFTFSDICILDLLNVAPQLGITNASSTLKDGCDPEINVSYIDAHETINYYATAFLNYHLRDSAGSKAYLIQKTEKPFDSVNFYEGNTLPDWPEGGCGAE